MCGISGFILYKSNLKDSILGIAKKINDTLTHRGPDYGAEWANAESGVALSHRRLSIIDLSATGNQPMHSLNKRYVIVFNGEIYNHLEIRKRLSLEKILWRGGSDTETLLELINLYGIKKSLNYCKGMYAFALWDNKLKNLTIVRDPIGEKPLYYGWINNNFVFASEIRAFKKFPDFNNKISTKSVNLYTRYNSIPAPYSIYENIFKLEPGTLVKITINNLSDKILEKEKIWSLNDNYNHYSQSILSNENDASLQLKKILQNSVRLQMISDVPIGSFLSGGVDSSLITAIMQEHSRNPVNTFTIGYKNKEYDESDDAKKISDHLKTNHHQLIVSPEDCLSTVKDIARIFDEPFADSSQIPTFLVSKEARKKVKVILTGDAADELFGGYNRYTLGPKYWKFFSTLPFPCRKLLGYLISIMPLNYLNYLFDTILNKKIYGGKVKKFGERLCKIRNIDEFLLNLATVWQDEDKLFLNQGMNFPEEKSKIGLNILDNDPVIKMMIEDLNNYIPNDILCKVDRSAMRNSLETRIPFLDRDVINFSFRIPISMKIKNIKFGNKWILRKILKDYLPENLTNKPKKGFEVPIGNWIKGPLKSWAKDLLDEDSEFFDPDIVRKFWNEHQAGYNDWTPRLWSIIVFQSWLKENHT